MVILCLFVVVLHFFGPLGFSYFFVVVLSLCGCSVSWWLLNVSVDLLVVISL